jgi:hypothetical protein
LRGSFRNALIAGRLIPPGGGEVLRVGLDSLSWSDLVTRAKEAEAAAARSEDAEIKAEWLRIARCYRELADQKIKSSKARSE